MFGLGDGRVVALNAADGARRWEQRIGGRPDGLAAAGDRRLRGSLDNFFYCLDGSNRPHQVALAHGRRHRSATAALDADRVYFVSLDNLLRALDRNSGAQRWKKPLAARPVVGPCSSGRRCC